MKTELLQIRIKKEDKEKLTHLAEKLDVPVSQLVREAVAEKIQRLRNEPRTLPLA